jgi:hypothetical protein
MIRGENAVYLDPRAATLPSFTVAIKNTQPITVYCAQAQHCQAGMVMVINPTQSGATSLGAYQALSAKAKTNTPAKAVTGGTLANLVKPAAAAGGAAKGTAKGAAGTAAAAGGAGTTTTAAGTGAAPAAGAAKKAKKAKKAAGAGAAGAAGAAAGKAKKAKKAAGAAGATAAGAAAAGNWTLSLPIHQNMLTSFHVCTVYIFIVA